MFDLKIAVVRMYKKIMFREIEKTTEHKKNGFENVLIFRNRFPKI